MCIRNWEKENKTDTIISMRWSLLFELCIISLKFHQSKNREEFLFFKTKRMANHGSIPLAGGDGDVVNDCLIDTYTLSFIF